jgi:ectoine hydroxylase-related dioxygenase (phytanoyl-CoA dioxygenase family)
MENTLRSSVERDGFAVVPEIFAPEEAAGLANELSGSSLRRSRAGVRHALANNAVQGAVRDERLLMLAREVLGTEALPFRVTLFDKSPVANWLVVWHQDTALPLRERRDVPDWGPWSVKDGVTYAHAPADALSQILALRLHLDDSGPSNGPLRVLPGTHTLGVLTDQAIHELAATISPVECLARRGGVLAMRPLLVHGSSKSQIQVRRRVLHIEYAAKVVFGEGLELAPA